MSLKNSWEWLPKARAKHLISQRIQLTFERSTSPPKQHWNWVTMPQPASPGTVFIRIRFSDSSTKTCVAWWQQGDDAKYQQSISANKNMLVVAVTEGCACVEEATPECVSCCAYDCQNWLATGHCSFVVDCRVTRNSCNVCSSGREAYMIMTQAKRQVNTVTSKRRAALKVHRWELNAHCLHAGTVGQPV